MSESGDIVASAAALVARFTQDTRLLQLTTDGPDQLLVESARIDEGLSELFRCEIDALSLDAGIALKSLIGQPVLLELQTHGQRRPFHGHVTAVEHSGSNGGFARYRLQVEPWTALLGHTRDSRVFQDMSVFDILDVLFARYQARGRLNPSWRYAVRRRDDYPRRSLTTQYQESDLAFAERLMREEGLFYWFRHRRDDHALIIADSNDAFSPNAQSTVRFTQSGATMKEDSIDRWQRQAQLQSTSVELRSWDYRSVHTRPVEAWGDGPVRLAVRDTPGVYAYADRRQGLRLAERDLQAIEATRDVFAGEGTVRTLEPGTTFTLTEHVDDDREFLVVRASHIMHNNLSAELLDRIDRTAERAIYRNRIEAIAADVPYRCARRAAPVAKQQSAIVVGPAGAVIHTDRDHRVKVQFHWQRGELSHSRLAHPAPEGHTGAPADDSAGTWVRVATSVAGANWGSHALPRIGQEVLVDFLDGDIDRPVIIGALYNGQGQDEAPHNQRAFGPGAITGNAPAWFPGNAHPAVLSGFKSQQMHSSQLGDGGYSQLVFDDSAGQARTSLQQHAKAHQGSAELNLGHLRHQSDNLRLNEVGLGAELKSVNRTALRAGKGMLLTADASRGDQLDVQAATEQCRQSLQLQTGLAKAAQTHCAGLVDEGPAAIRQLAHGIEVLTSRDEGVAAFSEPLLQLSAQKGIAAVTPEDAVVASGMTSNLAAGDSINFASKAGIAFQIRAGISLFTYGQGKDAGMRLHAASGAFSSQSQSGETRLTAEKTLTVASTAKSVTTAAREYLAFTAQGACLKIEGGNISLHAPGVIEFRASKKDLVGPSSSLFTAPQFKGSELAPDTLSIEHRYHDDEPLAGAPFEAEFANGEIRTGTLDGAGRAQLKNVPPGAAQVRFGPMPGAYKRKDQTPTPNHRTTLGESDIDALIDKYTSNERKPV